MPYWTAFNELIACQAVLGAAIQIIEEYAVPWASSSWINSSRNRCAEDALDAGLRTSFASARFAGPAKLQCSVAPLTAMADAQPKAARREIVMNALTPTQQMLFFARPIIRCATSFCNWLSQSSFPQSMIVNENALGGRSRAAFRL
jgi:hypothetical protein